MVRLLLLSAGLALGQASVIDVMNAIALTGANSTPIVSVTASQGDGSTCTIFKLPGATIAWYTNCQNAGGTTNVPSYVIRPGSTVTAAQVSSVGNAVYCLVVMNPTASAVTYGSFGNVLANGLNYMCSTNTTAGGGTPVVTGKAQWP